MKKILLVFLGIALSIFSFSSFGHTEKQAFAQSVIFQDDFETQLTNWQIHQSGGNYTETSSNRSQSGNRSLRLHYTGNDYLSVKHNMPSEQTGIVRVWFFDDMDASLGTVFVLRDKNDIHRTHIGVNTSVFPSHYYYRLDNAIYNSQIARSLGWHKFEIISTPKGTYGKIDGLPIACRNKTLCNSEHYIPINNAQKNFYTIDFVSTWGLSSDAYYDNVQVETLWQIPGSISEREYRVIENILASYGATNFTDAAFSGEGSRYIANLATAHALKYRKAGGVDNLNKVVNLIQRVANNHGQWKFPFWQSSLTSYDLGLAAWLVWDRLDEPTKHLVRSVILEEADLWANEKPKSGYINDSKAEENAWTASFLALAANMFPNDEGATRRDKTAKCFAFHSITRNETYCGVSTRTVYDDFTLDNHGIHGNSNYSLATIELLGAGALTYSKTGKQIPYEFKHNVVELWNNAKGRISPVDYRFTYNDDWGANASAIWQDGALAYLSTVFGQAVNYENDLTRYEYLIHHDYVIYPVGSIAQINEYNPNGTSDSFIFLMNTREAHFPTILFHDPSLILPPTTCSTLDLATPTSPAPSPTNFKIKTWEGSVDASCDQTSLKLTTTIPANAEAYSPLIAVQPNTEYTVSYWVKTAYTLTSAEVFGRVLAAEYNTSAQETDAVNVNRVRDGRATGTNLGGTNEWRQQTYNFTTSSETRYLRLRALMALWGTATGEVWYKDLRVVESPACQSYEYTTYKRKIWSGGAKFECINNSLKITGINADAEAYSPLISVSPNTTYTVSYKAKTAYMKTDAQVYGRMIAAEYNSSVKEGDEVNINRIKDGRETGTNLGGTNDWTEKTYSFRTSPTTYYLRLRAPVALWGTATGEVWYDEVNLALEKECTEIDLATPENPSLTPTTFKIKNWEGFINVSCESTTYHSAPSSLKISVPNPANAEAYSPLILVKANTQYAVSYWVKTNYTSTNAEVYGRLITAEYNAFAQETDEVNVNRVKDGRGTGTNLGSINNWVGKSYTLTTSSETKYVRLRAPMALWGTATGTVWYDEVKIEETVPSLSLSPDSNQITWPGVSGYKASDIPAECPVGVTKENFWFKPYVRNFGGLNFSFEEGKTYFIKCNQETVWQL